jgi:5'-nucleotidase
MTKPCRTAWLIACATMLAALLSAGPALAAKPPKTEKTIDVQLLAINDFHGNLQPPAGSSGRITTPSGPVDAGGVEYLSTHVKQLEQSNRRTVVVAAGDLIGASPLLSALFHDEPTIEAMNEIGLDIASVGNHEFDEGSAELLRMQNGGCHPTDGCQDGDPFGGADFQYLSANVVREDTGKTLFPAYEIRKFRNVRVAFIGMTLEATPTIVTPSGVAGLDFRDEVETVNALVPELRRRKVEAIVVLIHEGGLPTGLYNECPGISGPIVDIVSNLDDAVDVVVSGHTHQAYNCVIDGKPVTSASSFGRLVTDIDLTLDRRSHDVSSVSVNNVIVTRDVAPDPAQTALIAKYDAVAAPLANRVIGQVTADITRTANAAGESALGDVIADAQLDATDEPDFGDAIVAFMNPGGIRTELTFAQSGSEGDGNVTYGEAFAVQPFGNSLVTMTLTGAEIDTLLEQQFDNPEPGQSRMLQVSEGFMYTWDAAAPVGSRVDPASITIDGLPLDVGASYRVTVNSFLADGGDNFTVLRNGTDRLGGEVDLDALVTYFETSSPVAPGAQDRITRLN